MTILRSSHNLDRTDQWIRAEKSPISDIFMIEISEEDKLEAEGLASGPQKMTAFQRREVRL